MKLAILFWFYKEPEICLNRLKLIKKHNPNLKVFGLFGGDHDQAPTYKKYLAEYLDDFYTITSSNPNWKWLHGDLALLEWYEQRGQQLDWDSIAIVQWDMLVFDAIEHQLPEIKANQMYISGYQVLDLATENSWDWTAAGEERQVYLQFLSCMREKYSYTQPPVCCLFIFEIFPKIFFEKYSHFEDKTLGMLEYKIPILAHHFGIPIYQKDLGVFWDGDWQNYPLNAMPYEIHTEYIEQQLQQKNGWRIFHPYFKLWPQA